MSLPKIFRQTLLALRDLAILFPFIISISVHTFQIALATYFSLTRGRFLTSRECGSHKLPLQTGTALSQYPVMWPNLASHVTFSAPIRLYPSLQRMVHVDPYELSQFPSIKPFREGPRVWHFKTTIKEKKSHSTLTRFPPTSQK